MHAVMANTGYAMTAQQQKGSALHLGQQGSLTRAVSMCCIPPLLWEEREG